MSGCYCYDGTLAGLLTLYARLLAERAVVERISATLLEQQNLFSSEISISTDQAVAEAFWQRLTKRLSDNSLKLVAPVWKLSQQVAREAHRYLGFVRFQQLQGGLYYATIAPDHRILLLIGGHFAERFSDQQWVIHDQRHGEGILFDAEKKEWLLLPMEVTAQPDLTPEEAQFQELWRSYFSTLAIPERTNLKLQQGKVPLKARGFLTEFGGATDISCSQLEI